MSSSYQSNSKHPDEESRCLALQFAWWQALDEWYNHGDFRRAMDVWLQAPLFSRRRSDPNISSSTDADDAPLQQSSQTQERGKNHGTGKAVTVAASYSIDHLELQWNDMMKGIGHAHNNSNWDLAEAKLLVFLAGCCLDAGNMATARHCLYESLCQSLPLLLPLPGSQTKRCASSATQTTAEMAEIVATDALQEYMASYQEEKEEDQQQQQHWLVAQRIVALALRTQGGITKWTNIYQRPAFSYVSTATSTYASPRTIINGTKIKAVYPASEHPAWCRILEEHASMIQAEFEQLLLLRGSQQRYVGGGGENANTTTTATNDNATKANKNHANNTANTATATTTTNATSPQRPPTHWPAVGAGTHRGGAGEHDGTVVERGGDWREIVLMGTGARPELAPATVRLLRRHCWDDVVSLAEDANAGEVIFSVLGPGTRIRPHTASHNLRLTAHLGLRIPAATSTTTAAAATTAAATTAAATTAAATTADTTTSTAHDDGYNNITAGKSSSRCYIRVADQVCHWETGKMLVFDDSFEHEVANDTDEIRGVLLLRFWHPCIPLNERTVALQHVTTAKQDDRLRRCNPPLPPPTARTSITATSTAVVGLLCHEDENDNEGYFAAVTARGMERSVCPSCWETGYESIRLLLAISSVEQQQRTFVCVCGMPIE